MKNAKVLKPLLLSAAAIMLVVATMFATMAYLTASSAVSNVFTVGNVSMQMFESKVNSEGLPINAAGQVIANYNPNAAMKTADTNSYHLQPGMTYTKDPTVYVDPKSDEAYLFVRLRNDLKTVEAGNMATGTPADESAGEPAGETGAEPAKKLTIVEQMRENGWLEIERAESNVDAVFVYVGQDVTSLFADISDDVGDGKTYATYAERSQAIQAAAKAQNIMAQPVGKTEKTITYPIVDTYQAIDVFGEFSIGVGADLSKFGGARIAIVAYAIQTNGVSTATKYTVDACMDAWKWVKAELPFVS